jgi:hypothetical protein
MRICEQRDPGLVLRALPGALIRVVQPSAEGPGQTFIGEHPPGERRHHERAVSKPARITGSRLISTMGGTQQFANHDDAGVSDHVPFVFTHNDKSTPGPRA